MNIYVGNLPDQIDEGSLKQMFSVFGDVQSAKIIKDRFSGQPKGFGFVEMPSNSEADQAIKALNKKFMEGKILKVNHADSGAKKKKPVKRRRF